jgi:fibronectin-binding autotransporter adhesin
MEYPMRPASSRVVTLWISVLCLLAALFSLNGLALAQASAGSKRKASQQTLPSPKPVASTAATRPVTSKTAPPPVTTDTWTGSGGNSNWSTTGNWNNGSPSGDNILINLTTAATNVDTSFSIGTLTLSNAGDSVNINNNVLLTVGGNIANSGNINLGSTNNATELIVGAASVTLSGTGTLTTTNNSANFIVGAATADTLINSSTIQGSGNIGDNQMTLSNSGTIDATQSNSLTIQANGGVTNTGTLEATTGSLILYGDTGTITINNTGGTIKSTGSDVQLQSGVIINGGTLTTSGTGLIDTINGQSSTLENLTNAGSYQVDNNATTTLVGTITNNGNINLASTNNTTSLVASGSVSLAGSGTVTMTNNGANSIYGATSGSTLTIGSGQTVSGGGNIGYDPVIATPQLTLVNNGVIDANQPTVLYIETSGGTTNTGTLEATAGTLILYGNTVTQTGSGNITSTASSVELGNGVTIIGGKLNTSGSGLIHTISGQSATLQNLTNAGNYQVDNNGTTNLVGTITNNGNINLASTNNQTDLVANGNVSLAGTGTVTLTNNANNYIFGTTSASTLTVGSGQTITGSGDIGYEPGVGANMTLINNGIIDATQGTPLYIETSGGTTNTSTLEATTGTLILYGNTVTQTGNGKISSTGSDVQLQGGVTVIGGTLNTSGTGLIHTTSGQTGTLENLTNAGNYQVDNSSTTNLIGTITNNGNINLASTNSATQLVMNGNVTLAGTGTITMTNNSANQILGALAADVLTVGSGQTISGSGEIGENQMALVNNGVINATQPTALYIDTSNGTTNNKTLEATAGGTLILFGRDDNSIPNTVTNTNGTISAANASTVDFQNGIIINGGTLTTAGTGLIHAQSGYSATLENLTIAGNYQVDNNATTVVVGTIVNNGNINLASSNNATELQLSGNVTLNGTGTLTMSNNANNYIFGATQTGVEVLTNNINISGAGNFGDGLLIINNTSLGTINANQPNTLFINPTVSSSAGVTNTGLMEATAGGTLGLDNGTYINAVGSTQGTILANGGTVNLNNGVTIVGGKLQSENGSVIQNTATATLDGSTSTGAVTLVAGSTLNVLNNTTLDVKGSIVNNGTLSLLSSNNATSLVVNATSATLSGTGTMTMSNNANNYIYGAAGTDIFTNQQTIQGSGQIGDNQLTFVNNGTVNANQSTQLIIDASGGTTNTGTLEATAGGTLSLQGYTITNTGATIQANGVTGTGGGAVVNLDNGVIINGGTLSSNQFGSFNDLNSATLNGLTSNATLNVQNNTILNVEGTIVNNGALNLNSSNNATELVLQGNVALNGTGTVTMSNNTNNYIFGAASTDVLTVASTQTIQGAGVIGDNQMVLANNGTIDANVSNTLTISASGGTTNTKTIEATSGGTLNLVGYTVTNTGAGTIVAGSGSTVNLYNGVTLVGGSLTGSGNFVEQNGATLSGLTNASNVIVNNNTTMLLTGTIVNNGQIQENSTNNTTEILLTGNVTLGGTGTLVMTNNSANYIFGQSGSDVLTNANTIEGAGHIGDDQMSLVNSGTILANDSNVLAINVSGTVNNTGTFEATASGGLTVTAPTAGFLNYNSTSNTLTGGTYIANGGNITLPLGTTGGITTLAASVTEEGGSQILNSNNGNANALNGLTSITSAGALTIGTLSFTDAGAFSNAGSLTILPSTTFNVGSLSQISGGTLTAGTYVLDSNLNITGATQTFTTNAANVTLAGGLFKNANGSDAMAALASNTGKLTLSGGRAYSTSAASFSNAGTLTINNGSTYTMAALTQISGTTLTGGTFVLAGNLDLSTGTANITTNAATVTLEGTATIENTSNSSNALANLASNTKSLTLANGATFTTTGNFGNGGTLTINNGSTFTVLSGKALSNYKASTNTLQGGTFVVGGELSFNAGTTGAIETDAANLTLDGTGELFNSSSGAASTNALVNLNTISSTGALTLGQNANFTAAGNFTNSGKLTINSGSTFTLTGTNTLTNLASGTLTGGTYTVGGTLQLTSANGGITTNAANLTLTGTSAKILDGTANALAGFNNNSGSLTLSSSAALTTASSNFTNTGTIDVAKGSTLTLGGTGRIYSQTAGQTTIDGALAAQGGSTITGGTILGGGSIKGNVSVGNATGTAATINVGDSGKAGLLSITGKYTQLATGTMTGLINGTTAGSAGFSQMKVTGAASLAGTINFTVASAFQSSLTLGETFTVLSAASVTGTFSNSTIAINSSFQFNVSYTSTGVVLTVAAATPSAGGSAAVAAPVALAANSPKPAVKGTAAKSPTAGLSSSLRHGSGTSRVSRPVVVAGLASPAGHSNAILAGGSGLRSWEHVPVLTASPARGVVARAPLAGTEGTSRVSLPASNLRMSGSQAIGAQPPLANWMSASGNRRVPTKILQPMLPRMR